MPENAVILFGILNWGLGHATRSLPILQFLKANGHKIHVVSDGIALQWLKKEIPDVVFHEMPLSGFSYPTRFMWLNGLMMIPGFVRFVQENKKYAKSLAIKTGADVIISDNRFGFRCQKTKLNIYITHQVTIHHSNFLVQKLLTLGHQYFINKYHQCWIPDFKDNRMAGKLSCNKNIKNISYLGALSRIVTEKNTALQYDILILLSGPEPQRSHFEELLLRFFQLIRGKNICLVRGTNKALPFATPVINRIIHMADTGTLQKVVEESAVIICRSGYSTIMDLDRFGKKVIFVATPGQTEQEYLAQYHASKTENYFSIAQDRLEEKLPFLLEKLL